MPAEPAIPRSSTKRTLVTLFLVTGVAVVACTWLSLSMPSRLPSHGSAASAVDESDIANYVGNDACAPCHPTEFNSHKLSHHAMTLQPVTRAALGDTLPPTGRINNTQYSFVEQDGRFYFEVDPPSMPEKYQLWPLDFAFGSGVTGLTYVSMMEGRNVVAMKMSYFPNEHRWRVTPGQKLDKTAAAGNLGNLVQSRRCLSCHIVAMSKNAYVPRREFYGVGCESCHGPGRDHIAAIQQGAADKKMADLKHTSATELNTLCGACHRTEKDVIGTSKELMTYRFQPYGLMKSRCFVESGDRLSCQTCHDPHTDVVKNTAAYVAACLSCHSSAQIPGKQAAKAASHGKVCPVSPLGNCIPCHMPKRDVLSAVDDHFGMSMTDHLIGVYKIEKNNK